MSTGGDTSWVGKKPLRRVGGISDALYIASDLGFHVSVPPQVVYVCTSPDPLAGPILGGWCYKLMFGAHQWRKDVISFTLVFDPGGILSFHHTFHQQQDHLRILPLTMKRTFAQRIIKLFLCDCISLFPFDPGRNLSSRVDQSYKMSLWMCSSCRNYLQGVVSLYNSLRI